LLAALLLAGLQGFGIGGIGFLAQIAQVLLGGIVGWYQRAGSALATSSSAAWAAPLQSRGQAAQEAESGNIVLHLL
jgi:hypothetical protein